jgi:transcriptional regulator GlxA family with amidase domain
MKQPASMKPDHKDILHFDIILSDDFILMELAGVVDVLRISNRILGFEKFQWKLYSERGGRISASAGAFVETAVIPKLPNSDYGVFLGCTDLNYTSLDVEKYAARYRHASSKVILFAEAASRYIASNQEFATDHTTHWENRALLEEKKGIFGVKASLAVSDGQIITSAGMGTVADVILALVGSHVSSAKLTIVSKIILHDKIRAFDTLQTEVLGTVSGDASVLNKAIKLMQENIEEPITMSELANRIGYTPRWLERNFKAYLGCSPGRYYREIRMNHGHNLLRNTNMSIQEIALACGCHSGFSLAYQQVFGQTPHQARKALLDKM